MADKVINDRQYLKNHEDCLFLIADLEQGGFGAMVARRKLVYQIAHAFNRTVLFRYTNYLYDECFDNYSIHDFNEIKKMYKVEIFKFDINQKSKLCYFNFKKYWNSKYKNIYQCWVDPSLNISYLHFSGLILSQFKLKSEYQERINNIKQKLNLNEKTIGLHVRRGDKYLDGKLVEISTYMKFVNDIKDKTGINRVLVCSDDASIFGILCKQYKDFNFIQDDDEIRYNNANWSMIIHNDKLSKQETFTSIKTIELLSSCEFVIGQYNTQFTKLAGAKLSYKKNDNRLILIDEDNKIAEFGTNSKTS